jgi:hypothetical protein
MLSIFRPSPEVVTKGRIFQTGILITASTIVIAINASLLKVKY